MKRPRPFTVERRRLRSPKRLVRAVAETVVETPRQQSDGTVADDVRRILRGRIDFPKMLWGEVI